MMFADMAHEVLPAELVKEGCFLHADHGEAEPLILVVHHVQPRGMGGKDVASNRARVCDTGHRNVHTLLGKLANGYPMPAGGTASERALAQEGYDRWVTAGRPGDPHAAYALHPPVDGSAPV